MVEVEDVAALLKEYIATVRDIRENERSMFHTLINIQRIQMLQGVSYLILMITLLILSLR